MKIKKSLLGIFVLISALLSGCGVGKGKDSIRGGEHHAAEPELVSLNELSGDLSWAMPLHQETGGVMPPQPGTQVLGKTVKGSLSTDTNWTAFVLVLFRDENQNYQVLTQKRAIRPSGVIEAQGGHLTGGQTWAEGAATELSQEAGIRLKPSDLFYLTGGKPKISRSGNLYGNVNFFVLFKGARPETSQNCREIDQKYGHKWKDLREIYDEVQKEQQSGLMHGVYYSFFRGHVIDFCQNVLGWK